MKKAIITLAIVAVAGIINAASVSWSSGLSDNWVYSTNPDGSFNAGLYASGTTAGTAWLIYSTDNSLAGITVDGSGNISLGSGDTLAGTSGNTLTITSADGVAGAANGVLQSQNGGYLGMVVYDSDNQMYGISNIQSLSGVVDSPPSTSTYLFENDGAYVAANQAIPEPTSMALFALGAGVLGLRRRFKNKKA